MPEVPKFSVTEPRVTERPVPSPDPAPDFTVLPPPDIPPQTTLLPKVSTPVSSNSNDDDAARFKNYKWKKNEGDKIKHDTVAKLRQYVEALCHLISVLEVAPEHKSQQLIKDIVNYADDLSRHEHYYKIDQHVKCVPCFKILRVFV